ncbi:DNA-binding XRE family transcriptional regulator [Spelaeicoccus albus]|uniref:DNA-binding XRE family transcriptional regulator n=1 Tax=Spelaeicoccus albus TaxID=1280376 RepID=A0A7Z0D4R9_9MICO|nr:DNA-binding XRE family transcriptional regulator [Spelaeicoccus albus]
MATRAGVNESKIRQLEDHNYTDNPKLLARVAKIFDTSVHDLVE